ncbi:hypothetical protein PRZ48_003526 [Zasmidium cellare]|uniref:Uncharacterized protein n=1 Tax=Zasmidium cellare TaxID=395010 RepID=A0ABR0EWL2_ZASCE|nr:hypothetical protein PRZ48_003526 [Zasmidium cellare]
MSNKKQRPASDEATDGSARESPTDATANASGSKSQVIRHKPSLFGRLANISSRPKKNHANNKTASKRTWKAFHPTNVGLHLTQDPHPETNDTHRKLPEEHRAAHKEAKKMALLHQNQLTSPTRELHGPVPRNRLDSHGQMSPDAIQHIGEFRLHMDLNLLAPVSRDVLHLMRRTRRSSHFRPLLNPSEEILLVHQDDMVVIRQIQDMVRPLPEKEKYDLAGELHQLLGAEKNYALKLLLFSPGIRVTCNARGQGLGMEEAEGPGEGKKGAVGFAEGVAGPSSGQRAGGRRSEDTATQASSRINRTQTFEVKSEPRPGLRGGGGDDNSSVRSSSSYASFLRGSQYDRLENCQRVPKAMWWLAGGRGSSKGKQPTAGEMRERRKVEIENREQVGFWGTVLGRRAIKAKPVRTEVEEYKPADDGQETTTLQVVDQPEVVEMSGALPAPDHDKPLPPRPESSASVNDAPPNEGDASKSPADSIVSDTSNREQPAEPPTAGDKTTADDESNRETGPPADDAVEQGK